MQGGKLLSRYIPYLNPNYIGKTLAQELILNVVHRDLNMLNIIYTYTLTACIVLHLQLRLRSMLKAFSM